MSNPRECERCGQPLAGAASDNICPRCVAQLGQATWLGESATEASEARADESQPPPNQPAHPDILRIQYFGDYELIEEIARGGMGTVYRARQVSLNRPVALKLISAGALATSELVKRFQAEAELAANLTHPNIVPIHEIGQHDGQHYFSMGLVDGPSLRKHLKGHPMAVREAAALLARVARAVHYANQRGILHRDLKPSNIVLDRDGVPHLTDFGLAKLVERESTLTHTNAVLGTPSYMAPEQARGATKEVTTAADVYGLGAVLYEALTGHPPFAGGTSVETIRQVLDQEPRRPSLWNRAVDRDLETICLKCLEKEPERRYASADALASELDRWRHHEPILARRISTWEHTRKWLRRRPPAFFAMAAAVMLSLIAGLAGMLWQWNEAAMARDQALEERRRAEQHAQAATEREKEVRRYYYAAQMNLLQGAWEQSDIWEVRRLLEDSATYPDRGFEWYYWQQQVNRTSMILRGHFTNTVRAVSYSPDGRHIVSGANDGTVKVWDAADGVELRSFGVHSLDIVSVAFSPDGRRILTVTVFGVATVWDSSNGEELVSFRVSAGTVIAAYSPDGQRVVTGLYDGTARVWDSLTGREQVTIRGHRESIRAVDFSPDGQRIVTASNDGTAKVWDASHGNELFALEGHARGHYRGVNSVAFCPGGRRIVTGSITDRNLGSAKVWDASNGRELFTLHGHRFRVNSVAFCPDGKRIVTGSEDGTVKVWDANTGENLITLAARPYVYSVAFSPNGQRVVAGSSDGLVRVWDVSGGEKPLTREGHSGGIRSAALSRDGQQILTLPFGSAGGLATVCRSAADQEGLLLEGHSGPIRWATFSDDGQWIVAILSDRTARMWDTLSGAVLVTIQASRDSLYSAAISPDGQRIATGGRSVTVWDTLTGAELLRFWRLSPGGITSVAFSPDGQRLATGTYLGYTKLWDAASGEELLTLERHRGKVYVAFSPDGQRLVTGSSDGTAAVWDASTGDRLASLLGHQSAVSSVAFSSDARRVLTGSDFGLVKVWDAWGGQRLLTLKGLSREISSVAFSPDNQQIIAGSRSWTPKVWNAASPEQVIAWLAEEEEERMRDSAPEP